jgi:hypothetical protein
LIGSTQHQIIPSNPSAILYLPHREKKERVKEKIIIIAVAADSWEGGGGTTTF